MSVEQSKESSDMLFDTACKLKQQGYCTIWSHRGNDALLNLKLSTMCDKFFERHMPNTGSQARDVMKVSSQIGEQIKETIAYALTLSPKAIVYMEGDKNSFVPYISSLAEPIFTGKSDLAVATRSRDGFHAFPKVQQIWEGLFNWYAGLRTGFKKDWIYGPKVFTQETAKLMLDYKDDDWGVIIHPIAASLKRHNQVVGVEVPGFPQEDYMKKYEDVNFLKHFAWRMLQFRTNVKGLHSGLRSKLCQKS
jgi:hypothetical protein